MSPHANRWSWACLAWQLALGSLLWSAAMASAEDKPAQPQQCKHQVTGLFGTERIADLRAAFDKLPQIKLLSVDFDHAEISVEYDPVQAFPGKKPEEIVEQFGNVLHAASGRTFGIKPLCAIPQEQLRLVEIPVVGLDCKGCCLAAYESIYMLPGVQWATASFKQGRVTAWISAETNREKLEAALKERGVTLKTSETPPK